jgi:uncharacterized Zn-binding protein involved in type VI secretion
MGKPAATRGDKIIGIDTHVVLVPSPVGPVPTPTPMPFSGSLSGELSRTVVIDNKPAATAGSTADNAPAHVPAGGSFQRPPSNRASVQMGSRSVLFENKQAARMSDPALTCSDPADAPNGRVVVAACTMILGD